MATVFMKWLETSPKDYDRGIQLLTLGRLTPLKARLARRYVSEGTRVLEIGCGTGTLTGMMAEHGGLVEAIDASAAMLAEAQKKAEQSDWGARVHLHQMDATQIEDHFEPESFDLIVSTLVFSELSENEQDFVLDACHRLLAPGGRLVIADEVVPESGRARLLFFLVRLPLVLLTWLLTRTTTRALQGFSSRAAAAGFTTTVAASFLAGSLQVYEATLQGDEEDQKIVTAPHLTHRVTLKTLLLDLYLLFFRILPPYPKVRPGLYAVGNPDRDSPVLVTGNFDLTVRRVVREIDGKVNVWLLVADSAGINVWCAAGGGYFTAEKVIAAVKSSRLEKVVRHHALILPQLCANGVDGWKIRHETGWGVHWGPVRARDIPAYLENHRKKTDRMRWVDFPLKDRLEMVTTTMGFYGLLILVPVFIFWRSSFWPIAAAMLGLSYFYAIVHPWLPGKDGLWKSIPLTAIALAGLGLYAWWWHSTTVPHLFNWALGLTGLSVFTGAELQGMSPLMRGEQANWGWEAAIGIGLGLAYWVFPILAGWR